MNLDVAVVGASSAGLYAADKLARAGKRVAVFEQSQTLDPARRTLIVTPQLTKQLGPLPNRIVRHQIEWIEIASAHNALTRIRFNEPDLIVERRALIQYLADKARASGVEIYFGHRFRALTAGPREVELSFQHSQTGPNSRATVTGSAVLGADGAFSDVAKAVGLAHPYTAPILQAEVMLPAGWNPALTKVWFDTDDTHYFYWLIPESHERGVLGLVGDERAPLRPTLQRFLERQQLEPLGFQGARIALHRPKFRSWVNVGKTPVLLIGDAAGQVKVSTVGGTVSGFAGADAAVRALLQGTPYRRELAEIQRELNLHYNIRQLLDRLDNAGYTHLVRSVNPRVQSFLAEHHRDEMAPHAVALLLRQPGLVKLGWHMLRKRDQPRNPSLDPQSSQTDPVV